VGHDRAASNESNGGLLCIVVDGEMHTANCLYVGQDMQVIELTKLLAVEERHQTSPPCERSKDTSVADSAEHGTFMPLRSAASRSQTLRRSSFHHSTQSCNRGATCVPGQEELIDVWTGKLCAVTQRSVKGEWLYRSGPNHSPLESLSSDMGANQPTIPYRSCMTHTVRYIDIYRDSSTGTVSWEGALSPSAIV
jgi:hypothetical protein